LRQSWATQLRTQRRITLDKKRRMACCIAIVSQIFVQIACLRITKDPFGLAFQHATVVVVFNHKGGFGLVFQHQVQVLTNPFQPNMLRRYLRTVNGQLVTRALDGLHPHR
jgi:hypothetical protein